MRKVVLECKNVGKKIGDKLIINDISLEVREGTIMGLIGPNGSGKTTLMKLILGLQELSSGEIIINGYKKTECFEQAIKDVGTIIENPDMYMYLTGYQNLKLVANLYNKKHTDIIRISKIVGINTYLNKKIKK